MDNLFTGADYWLPGEEGLPIRATLVAVNPVMGAAKLITQSKEFVAPLNVIFKTEKEALTSMVEIAEETIKYYASSLEKLKVRQESLALEPPEEEPKAPSSLILA